MKGQLGEQVDEGMTSTERELNKQFQAMTEQYKIQVAANKKLSANNLSMEKQLLDEKRKRLDLERKLAMQPAPIAQVTFPDANAGLSSVDDLKRV